MKNSFVLKTCEDESDCINIILNSRIFSEVILFINHDCVPVDLAADDSSPERHEDITGS